MDWFTDWFQPTGDSSTDDNLRTGGAVLTGLSIALGIGAAIATGGTSVIGAVTAAGVVKAASTIGTLVGLGAQTVGHLTNDAPDTLFEDTRRTPNVSRTPPRSRIQSEAPRSPTRVPRSPTRPEVRRTGGGHLCPPGTRWDPRRKKCVRLRTNSYRPSSPPSRRQAARGYRRNSRRASTWRR